MFNSKSICLLCFSEIQNALTWKALFSKTTQHLICEECLAKLEQIPEERCPICSRPMAERNICFDCERWNQDPAYSGYLIENTSLFLYNEYLKEIIAKYKYRGDYAIAEAFAPFIKEKLKKLEFDIVTAIPLSEERLTERGFNQAEALTQTAGQHCENLLTRIHTEKQSKKSRQERISLPQVFQITNIESIEGKTILLIDDIYTTGSTLRHAAKALKRAGAKEIRSLTLAR
jgi:competence protein ComFC